jgi:hypothetical protein
MRASLLWVVVMLLFSDTAHAQYVDTIAGRLKMGYNDPTRYRAGICVGAAFDITAQYGSVPVPVFFAHARLKTIAPLVLDAGIRRTYDFGWQYQEIAPQLNYTARANLLLARKVLPKSKTFTAGAEMWKYDFVVPVDVQWNIGICAGIDRGSRIFNTAQDSAVQIRVLRDQGTHPRFREQVGIPYTMDLVSAGICLTTRTRFKATAILPQGNSKTRRMKSYTQVNLEYLWAQHVQMDSVVWIRDDYRSPLIRHQVLSSGFRKGGIRLSADFHRRLLGCRLESGIRPGPDHRFSLGERDNLLNRFYVHFGISLGWM